ncbi:MAG: S-methyl-5-thioribose-1-phosphate isomerase [Bacteroidota bacterium]
MKVNQKNYRTVWLEDSTVKMIDQTLLPFEFKIIDCATYTETCEAICTMKIRGAGAIGAAAAFAMAQAYLQAPVENKNEYIAKARHEIEGTRPTAQNLFYAVARVFAAGQHSLENALSEAQAVADEDALASQAIGQYGNELIRDGMGILTHCNAGWLAFVDYGTALSPIYTAHHQGKKLMLYVDETRPRGQGARLTAWELQNEGVPHAIIPDNAAAYFMWTGKIQMVIVGADRITANGDVANKIGTFQKALAAKTMGIPFYVAAPTSTFDSECESGKNIPIEFRSADEVLFQTGPDLNGIQHTIRVCSPGSDALNPAFDVTPAEFITGIITEKGIIKPEEKAIRLLGF